MTDFRPYCSTLIHEAIRTEAEHALVATILQMDAGEILDLRDDINTEAALDPDYRFTRDCKLKCKAIIRRAHHLKRAQARQGIPLIDAIGLTMAGMVLGDEFSKRFLRRGD